MNSSLFQGFSFREGRITLAEWNGKTFRLKILHPLGSDDSPTAHHADLLFEGVQKLFFPVRAPTSEIHDATFSHNESGQWEVEFYFEPGGMASRIECAAVSLLSSTDEGKWEPATIPDYADLFFGTSS